MFNPENPEGGEREFKAPDEKNDGSDLNVPEWLKPETKEAFTKVLADAINKHREELGRMGMIIDQSRPRPEDVTGRQRMREDGWKMDSDEEMQKKYNELLDAEINKISRAVRSDIERNFDFNATLMPEDLRDLVNTMDSLDPLIRQQVRERLVDWTNT